MLHSSVYQWDFSVYFKAEAFMYNHRDELEPRVAVT